MHINVTLSKDNGFIFDPEYFIVNEQYVDMRQNEQFTLVENNGDNLKFENDQMIYCIDIDHYIERVIFSNTKKSNLKDTLISYEKYSIGSQQWYLDMREYNKDNMIYRIGEYVNIKTPEMLIYNTDKMKEANTIFFFGDFGMKYVSAVHILHALFNNIGGTDVSVNIYSPEEFVERCKMVKRIVYDNRQFCDILPGGEPSEFVNKAPVFAEVYNTDPLIIYDKDGSGFLKRSSDSFYEGTRVSVHDKKGEIHWLSIDDVTDAKMLVVPQNIDDESIERMLYKLLGGKL